MKNYVGSQSPVTITAPSAVLSGQGLLVGSMFGVCGSSAASGAKVALDRVGVYSLPKLTTDAPSQGQKAYWDNTNARTTVTSSGNTLIGYYRDGAQNGDATAIVVLTGQAT